MQAVQSSCEQSLSQPLAYLPKAALAASFTRLAATAHSQPEATASFFAGTAWPWGVCGISSVYLYAGAPSGVKLG